MANTIVLQDTFSLGMRQDISRDALPEGAVWNMVDFVPDLNAPLTKRGGWTRPYDALGAGSYAAACGFANFSAGSQVVGVGDGNQLYSYAVAGATATSRGTLGDALLAPPVFYRDKLYFPRAGGAGTPYSYDGSTNAANMGGTAPNGALACVFKDHLVLARSSANPNRKWFANAGDPTTWVTGAGGQWDDSDFVVQALAATRNMIVVFGEGKCTRVRFEVIPGVAGSDYVEEPLFNVGCSDPASVAVNDDYVVFANSSGVYLTDGIGLQDLTEAAGIKQLWLSTLSGYDSSYVIAATIFRNKYHCSIMDGSTFIDSFVFDLFKKVAWRNTNIGATMMVATPIGLTDTAANFYMSERGAARVASLGSLYSPTSGTALDGDNDNVVPYIETGYYKGRPGLKRWRRIYVSGICYSNSGDPKLGLYYSIIPEATPTQFVELYEEMTQYRRFRSDIRQRSEGVSLKIQQNAASSEDTRIYAIEAEVTPLERSKLI